MKLSKDFRLLVEKISRSNKLLLEFIQLKNTDYKNKGMKVNYKYLLATIYTIFFVETNVFAYDCEIDGFYYDRIGETEFSFAKCPYDYKGNVTIPSIVTFKGKSFVVVEIGSVAFYNCTSVTSVSIPNSIIRIMPQAFMDCTSLTSIAIPNSVTQIRWEAFFNCI